MSANHISINELLERYFAADTSLEEEKVLKTYFQSDQVQPDHAPYKHLFDWTEEGQMTSLSPDFSARVMDKIASETPVRRLSFPKVLSYAAAIGILVIAIWWIGKPTSTAVNHTMATTDTFEDPEEAYQEFTAALRMVAGAMDQGQTITLESVAPTQELNIFSLQ